MIVHEYEEKLSSHGYKLTKQRNYVLKVFEQQSSLHLSAEDIFHILKKQKTNVGLVTIYRTLELFVELEILHKINFNDGRTRYEFNRMKNEHSHHHLICLACKTVLEFDDDLLELLEKNIQEQNGFSILDHQVKFFGYCKECVRNV